jgi:hypothetical protein
MDPAIVSQIESTVHAAIAEGLQPLKITGYIITTGFVFIGLFAVAWIQNKAAAVVSRATLRFTGELNKELERYKTVLSYGTGILLPRLEAYRELWARTEPVRPTRKDAITVQEKDWLWDSLTTWYYQKGNGLLLSIKARDLLFNARGHLKSQAASDYEIKTAFSDLRTCLKNDVKIYEELEGDVEGKTKPF